MNIRIIFYLFLFLICCCCQQQTITEKNKLLIIGEWRPLDDYYYLPGYHFMENGSYENKLGFFSYFRSEGFLLYSSYIYCFPYYAPPSYLIGGGTELNNVRQFYGNKSYYKIQSDTLIVYDPAKNKWIEQFIHFQSPDTMILSYITECDKLDQVVLTRKTYEISDQPLFDQIIFHYPYGIWPSRLFSIQRDGTFVSYGYKSRNELFWGKIKEEAFNRIDSLFRMADLENTKTELHPDFHNPSDQPLLTFIHQDKMKTIWPMVTPYENKEFYWAYISGLFSPNEMYIESTVQHQHSELDILVDEQADNWSYMLEKKDSVINLKLTEQFYIHILLYQGKKTTESFTPLYRLINSDHIIAETDGQYFRYISDSKKEVWDIGFNFVEENQLDLRLKRK